MMSLPALKRKEKEDYLYQDVLMRIMYVMEIMTVIVGWMKKNVVSLQIKLKN